MKFWNQPIILRDLFSKWARQKPDLARKNWQSIVGCDWLFLCANCLLLLVTDRVRIDPRQVAMLKAMTSSTLRKHFFQWQHGRFCWSMASKDRLAPSIEWRNRHRSPFELPGDRVIATIDHSLYSVGDKEQRAIGTEEQSITAYDWDCQFFLARSGFWRAHFEKRLRNMIGWFRIFT